jgi:hypothetical protein
MHARHATYIGFTRHCLCRCNIRFRPNPAFATRRHRNRAGAGRNNGATGANAARRARSHQRQARRTGGDGADDDRMQTAWRAGCPRVGEKLQRWKVMHDHRPGRNHAYCMHYGQTVNFERLEQRTDCRYREECNACHTICMGFARHRLWHYNICFRPNPAPATRWRRNRAGAGRNNGAAANSAARRAWSH